MGRRFIPTIIVMAVAAFAVAAVALAFVADEPRLWSAAVALIVLGGITPMIYAVNVRIVPVFSRRQWVNPTQVYAAISAGVAGGWLVFLGRWLDEAWVERAGHGLALIGGALFVASLIRLFTSEPVTKVAPPLPFPEQAAIDKIGISFTRMAGMYLLLGLAVGLMMTFWTPDRGRWELVWAHAMLLGWFLQMVAGVCYHVLSRWTGARWQSPQRIRWHLLTVTLGLPAMVAALALDLDWLFAVAGPLQAIALGLFVWNIAPLVLRMPSLSRLGMLLAAGFLVVGITIGASAALDPANGIRLRFSHATINLLGFAGLLICGVGYYLFPRLAGQALRWPRLATIQIAAHASGVALVAAAWWYQLAVDDGAQPLITAGALLVAAGFAVFGGIVAATFQGSGRGVVAGVSLQPRRSPQGR
ncbi:MAG TPA: hypothetical protein VFV93_12720 [Thermomicrobiales bacterium]|nr:hypothetical protein [Thermomicrobiales bacterium]